MIGLQTIFAQTLFSNELLSLSITYILELEAFLKLMFSIAELAYVSTLNWILTFQTIGVSKIFGDFLQLYIKPGQCLFRQ